MVSICQLMEGVRRIPPAVKGRICWRGEAEARRPGRKPWRRERDQMEGNSYGE